MKKAKSRLKTPPVDAQFSAERGVVRGSIRKNSVRPLLAEYLSHLPTLFIAGIFYCILFFIFFTVDPDTVKNMLLPNSYLPVIVVFLIAHFFLISFICIDAKRGFFYSVLLTVWFFLTIQQVIFTIPVFLFFGCCILIFEFILRINRR